MSKEVYLLIGKEEFLKREFVQNLRKRFLPSAESRLANFQEFHPKTHSLEEVLQFVSTAPFLGQKRIGVLRQVDALPPDRREALLAALSALPSTGVLVFVSDEASTKRNSFLEALSKRCKVIPCQPPYDKDLPFWVERRFKASGGTVERDAVLLLVERVGRDTAALASAVEQALLFVSPRDRILRGDVENLFGRSAKEEVFSLLDEILKRDARAALTRVEALLRDGTRAPEILAVLTHQCERLARAEALLKEGRAPGEIGTELKVHPFFLDKFLQQARGAEERWIRGAFERLLVCDEAIKTGKLAEDLAMEMAVLGLCC
ncbi:MAG: DNA polymerase III subunit delta [Candidatus Omnitrophica bacterium]|nr:DNA polymerase III subunit delta [Candidatus Omnitrophota bacterium]